MEKFKKKVQLMVPVPGRPEKVNRGGDNWLTTLDIDIAVRAKLEAMPPSDKIGMESEKLKYALKM